MRIKGKLVFEADSIPIPFDVDLSLHEPSVKEQIEWMKEEFDLNAEEAVRAYIAGVGYQPKMIVEEYEFYEED